ncbi:glycosyl-4,4'-diaponeurosporenoate acyltransferase CrtO family protein [Winogradskyella costae]|uniref:glycosyl-4,4'-diaponeurosporenoate acyltransferase CrtO family protein n=1 Tax=Winogradskyella costae TaxID=2697008 RepID=UPI0015CC7D41|nr:hypothetical protein [Winogradskyella costae]
MLILLYFLQAITFTFVSWTIGLLLNNVVKHRPFYGKISHLNFIKNEVLRQSIGLSKLSWIIKNSFFKVFNKNLNLKNRTNREDLQSIRTEMVYAEIGHLIGFVFLLIVSVIKLWNGLLLSALIVFLFNIIFNLYPILLQQQNKSRIDRILK